MAMGKRQRLSSSSSSLLIRDDVSYQQTVPIRACANEDLPRRMLGVGTSAETKRPTRWAIVMQAVDFRRTEWICISKNNHSSISCGSVSCPFFHNYVSILCISDVQFPICFVKPFVQFWKHAFCTLRNTCNDASVRAPLNHLVLHIRKS